MARIQAAAIAALLMASLTGGALAQFEGDFDFRWLPDKDGSHREMMLLSDVAFVDKDGQRWPVPAMEHTDGASIPEALWSFAGTPFTGTYRRAAVIHDYYCRIGTLRAATVHDLFLQGMLIDGTSLREALSKYGAVVLYDPGVDGCGVESRASAELFELSALSNAENLGATLSNEVLAAIMQFEAVPLSEIPLQGRISGLIDLAQIERRDVYESLVRFAAVPVRDNYLKIEQAVAEAQPNRRQLEVLVQLARGTFPSSDYSSQVVSNLPDS